MVKYLSQFWFFSGMLAMLALAGLATVSKQTAVAQTGAAPPVPGSPSHPCHSLTSAQSIPQGYGAAYNLFSVAKEVLIAATCDGTSANIAVGSGAQTQYIYKKFYRWDGSAWVPREWRHGGKLVDETWYVGSASDILTSTGETDHFVAYICQWIDNDWKCGCRDTSCTESYWQLQAFKAPSETVGGGSAPSEVKECQNPKRLTATPSTVSSVIKNAGKCSVITLEPGTYGIHVKSSEVGRLEGITFRCKNPASLSGSVCYAKTIRLDGERRNRGNAQFESVIIENMVFIGIGTTYGGGNDYGVIAYNVDALRLANNIFNGTYHHDISTKEQVWYLEAVNNRFIKCARHCLELGQNGNIRTRPSTSETAVVRGNTFESPSRGITQRANRTLIVEGNTFESATAQAVRTEPYWAKYPFGSASDDGTLNVPKPPLRTQIIDNTFVGSNKLVFEGRGVRDDTVLIKGNTGSPSCSRIPMSDRSAAAHGDEETTAPPKLDPASDVSC